ncbi:MAG: MBL fold metallo-hydrolase [Candidatus Delongbacteria bacterium]|nr:MBL fold metallo-hydrolase [Candidatus Delongbacteria bacterium]MBN2836263.1 MBL fold metallo-hydrolase [Candidatus Delongbacteria bacterium]
MRIKFYGVRGSTPVPLTPKIYKKKVQNILEFVIKNFDMIKNSSNPIAEIPQDLASIYGGNTSCVYVESDKSAMVLDCGTGIRNLVFRSDDESYKEIDILFSHFHHDHISGLPFFRTLYEADVTLNFYSVHRELEASLIRYFDSTFFPVQFLKTPAKKNYVYLNQSEKYRIRNFDVEAIRLNHPNGSYGYRITDLKGKSIVYATDCEYPSNSDYKKWIEFYRNANLLIFDSQYTAKDMKKFFDYGHSTPSIGVDIAVSSNVEKLALFHHDPQYSEKQLNDLLNSAKAYRDKKYGESALDIIISNEGMELSI